MQYTEFLPNDYFSHHIECYWQMSIGTDDDNHFEELLLPTCTFNIIFTDQPCYISTKSDSNWIHFQPGAAFLGQRNNCIQIKSKVPLKLFGIRFKPFAFANIIDTPIFKLNDEFVPIGKVFDISTSISSLIQKIIETDSMFEKFDLMDDFMEALLSKSLSIDETLRAQLNYIMDRRGSLKISELLEEFNTTKVTLLKHFINKVGLTPKKISQIWRMNYVLKMKEDQPHENLTTLCLMAGFYDQAHFIKDFKLLFGIAPRKFFSQNTQLVKVAHQNISKRFTNQYDPR